MNESTLFIPNWASPPGDTIRERIQHQKITDTGAADSLGISVVMLEELYRGDRAVTEHLAKHLSDLIGATPKFWLTREAQYRSSIVRLHKG